ncbi:M16 family metallopeptidase [Conservatibacter flavescens]|uniref:Peptidase M16 n=1 Tax=Conservatibacter flavescens TaxID=28161 RepID=A0A2M8S5A0_9PAST|nr:M16 family metallopeptidase [Conservatibacter flavescens]PJG86322.1 peptidase M16 [Conservatibacter flavescens]
MRIIVSLFIIFLTSVSFAQQPVPIQGKLDNGLRYTLLPLDKQKGRIDVIMRVYAGGIDETMQQSGGAHMVEHLAFRASEKYPNGVMPYLHEQGWLRGKNYNAFTNQDHTTYLYMPPQHFSLAQTLDVVKQMLFEAQITEQDWEDERKIVLEEWRSRDSARRRLYEQRQSSTRTDSRYANRPVIGTEQSITTMPVKELQDYYRQWYVPNNMQLLLVGDFDVKKVEDMIRSFFGDLKFQPLPTRDYYEPTLKTRIQVDKLSDPQNNNSQVAYIWRFDDTASQEQTDEGFYQRLIDNLATALINQRFQDEKSQLPSMISSLGGRKYTIGKTTSVFMLSANVEKQSHHQALQYMIAQTERLKRYPMTEVELEKQKAKILAQLDNDRNVQTRYSFDEWVQEMINTVLNDKTFYPQAKVEELVKENLPQISLDMVNQRIQHWLASGDQIVQYMPPLTEQVEPISPDLVVKWQQQATQADQPKPAQTNLQAMQLPALLEQGSIVEEQRFEAQNVVYWTLSNGDKVVWLKTPVAKDKTYFVAQSEAGSNGKGVKSWQGKLALQLIGMNAPLDRTRNQMIEWKEQNAIPLVMRQGFEKLNILSTVENRKLADLLRFYYANQQETGIKEEFDKVKNDILHRLAVQEKSIDYKRNQAWEQFVYGRLLNPQPTAEQLNTISIEALLQQWQIIKDFPVTFFLVNDMAEADVKQLVVQNLSAIKRQKLTEKTPHLLILPGNEHDQFAANQEEKDNVYLAMYTPYTWTAKEAFATELLSAIASEKLSYKMRDETLGIYGQRFNTRLVPEVNRLQTTLTFSANPAMTQNLINMAKDVLVALPDSISQADLDTAKAYYKQTEDNLRNTPELWLNWLIYSENQFQDPRYLTEVNDLLEQVTLQDLKKLATQLYSNENQRLFITTPNKPEK